MFTVEDADYLLEEATALGILDPEYIDDGKGKKKKSSGSKTGEPPTDMDLYALIQSSKGSTDPYSVIGKAIGIPIPPGASPAIKKMLRGKIAKYEDDITKRVAVAVKRARTDVTEMMVRRTGWYVESIQNSDVHTEALGLVDYRGHKAYRMNLSFKPDAVFRPSVVQDPRVTGLWKSDRYTQFNGKFGIEDIVELLIHGYEARHALRYKLNDNGGWRWTRKSYHPSSEDNFMQILVDEFNDVHSADSAGENGDYYAFAMLRGAYR